MVQSVELEVVTTAAAQRWLKSAQLPDPWITGPEVDQRRLFHLSQLVMPVVSSEGTPKLQVADGQPRLPFQPPHVGIGRVPEQVCPASDQGNRAFGGPGDHGRHERCLGEAPHDEVLNVYGIEHGKDLAVDRSEVVAGRAIARPETDRLDLKRSESARKQLRHREVERMLVVLDQDDCRTVAGDAVRDTGTVNLDQLD
nr:hypothetical protein [Microlunatus soli]